MILLSAGEPQFYLNLHYYPTILLWLWETWRFAWSLTCCVLKVNWSPKSTCKALGSRYNTSWYLSSICERETKEGARDPEIGAGRVGYGLNSELEAAEWTVSSCDWIRESGGTTGQALHSLLYILPFYNNSTCKVLFIGLLSRKLLLAPHHIVTSYPGLSTSTVFQMRSHFYSEPTLSKTGSVVSHTCNPSSL